MKPIQIAFFLVAMAMFASCSEDKFTEEEAGAYARGFFITNEGPFQNGSGTVTFVGDDGNVSQGVYRSVNGEDLGNVVNSMHILQDKAFIVVNNSSRIVVADRNTMEKLAVIEGDDIHNPRHFIVSRGMGYVSNWGDPFDAGDDFIAVVDLNNYEVIKRIPVGEGPERMLSTPEGLYVVLQGGFGFNNQVALIDTSVNEVTKNIEVGEVPNSIQADDTGNVWVLCGGVPAWTATETAGALVRINPGDMSTKAIEFGGTQHPGLLNVDRGQLYYHLDGKVYRMNPGSAELPTESIEGLDGYYYSMTVHNGELYGTEPGDFASEGSVKVFSLASGELLSTIPAGIIPGSVVIPEQLLLLKKD